MLGAKSYNWLPTLLAAASAYIWKQSGAAGVLADVVGWERWKEIFLPWFMATHAFSVCCAKFFEDEELGTKRIDDWATHELFDSYDADFRSKTFVPQSFLKSKTGSAEHKKRLTHEVNPRDSGFKEVFVKLSTIEEDDWKHFHETCAVALLKILKIVWLPGDLRDIADAMDDPIRL